MSADELIRFGEYTSCFDVVPGDYIYDACKDGCCDLRWLVLDVCKAAIDEEVAMDFLVVNELGNVERRRIYDHALFQRIA